MSKYFGAINTPEGYARILTTWAVQTKNDIVLDMGVGEGTFAFQVFQRLKQLGASEKDALKRIYGTEINEAIFNRFSEFALSEGHQFPNIYNMDFFDFDYPKVNAIVGNPPYVRRRQMQQEEVQIIRNKTLRRNSAIQEKKLFYLTDLYVYFLLAALPGLAPGGRLATIIADTWLNARYGKILKKYLLSEFDIEQIISVDRSIFNDAQVKATLVLATKKINSPTGSYPIIFSRIKNGLPMEEFSSYVLDGEQHNSGDVVVKEVKPSELEVDSPWGAIFKTSYLFEEIGKKPIIRPIKEIANVQIGLQTLAKDFFVLSNKEKEDETVEEEYLVPFAYSIAGFTKPVIEKDDDPEKYLFLCAEPKSKLKNTKALKYIEQGEEQRVLVRGKDTTVVGYHNKDRIKKANRKYWYDIKTTGDMFETEILLPRFIYGEYLVLWNAAQYVPGGSPSSIRPNSTKSKPTNRYQGLLINII